MMRSVIRLSVSTSVLICAPSVAEPGLQSTTISPSCCFLLIFSAISSACLRLRQTITNSPLPCLPFHTVILWPRAMATRTFPVLGGMVYFAMFDRRGRLHRPGQHTSRTARHDRRGGTVGRAVHVSPGPRPGPAGRRGAGPDAGGQLRLDRGRDVVDQLLQHHVGGDTLGFALEVEDDAVTHRGDG